ncbi:MAG: prepilin-type N-terminal cleavage/methylation domain-containing protein [Candidatus Blackburnbacteria bacterium]|nr:prepilin-type N-terminal cleavage/methylation domain-containing protein [Candidatus Blackburnbacteria bacterium]
MRNKFSQPRTGFTLIEILVGLTIMAVLFGVGYASYREFARRQTLNTAFDRIKNGLSLAQQLALVGDKPSGCQRLNGYKVDFTSGSFTVSADCTNEDYEIRRVSLPGGITFSGASSILYKVLAQGTDIPSNLDVVFTQSATGKTLNAEITTQGVLKKQ